MKDLRRVLSTFHNALPLGLRKVIATFFNALPLDLKKVYIMTHLLVTSVPT